MRRMGSVGDFVADLSLWSDDNDGIGIVWSHTGSSTGNMYSIVMNNQHSAIHVTRRENNVNRYLQTTPQSSTWRYPMDTNIKARLTFIQGRIKFEVRFSGTSFLTAIEYTDSNPLAAGFFGFVSSGNSGSWYKLDTLKLLPNSCDRVSPSTAASLRLHLSSETFAQSSVGTAVTKWFDLSGLANHAVVDADSSAPNVVLSRWTSQKAVSFTSNDFLQLQDAGYLGRAQSASGSALFMVMDPKVETGTILKVKKDAVLLTEDFSGLSENVGFYRSNTLNGQSEFSSRFSLVRAGARFYSDSDWAAVMNGYFEFRDTNGWAELILPNVQLAGTGDVLISY